MKKFYFSIDLDFVPEAENADDALTQVEDAIVAGEYSISLVDEEEK